MSTEQLDFSEPVELLLLTISECYVYKVPPLRTASGHRAEDWNLANPLFTGCLKVYQADTKMKVSVYAYKDSKKSVTTDDNLQLFGECPIEVKPGDNIISFVDAVIDSSRYYVIRIKDPKSTRTTLLGIGFREREQAFDLKNTLNEYVRYVSRMDLASQMAALVVGEDNTAGGCSSADSSRSRSDSSDKSSNSTTGADLLHLSQHINPLKEGEKIKISINGAGGAHRANKVNDDGSGKPKSGGFLLKPPPPPGSTVFINIPPPASVRPAAESSSAAAATDRLSLGAASDEFSDFTSAGGATPHTVTESSSILQVPTTSVAEATDDNDDWSDFA